MTLGVSSLRSERLLPCGDFLAERALRCGRSGAIDAHELMDVLIKLGKKTSLEEAQAFIDEAMGPRIAQPPGRAAAGRVPSAPEPRRATLPVRMAGLEACGSGASALCASPGAARSRRRDAAGDT